MESSRSQPHVSDLAFQVFSRSIHPDWFEVRAHRRVVQDGWEADVRIVDGGHAITWRYGPIRLTEVLTVASLSLPEAGLLYHSNIRGERSTLLRPGAGIEYQMCFELEQDDPEVFRHTCDEMALDAGRNCLVHSFSSKNRLVPASLTHIRIESRARGLLVHSFHSFPAEKSILRTQSLFDSPVALPAPGV